MKNWINLYFQEVLDKKRLWLLEKLIFFKKLGFYLAWWTALALQFWHRQSIDFDFFINENIDTKKLYKKILDEFKQEKVIKTFEEENTLYIEINNIKLSFMTYKYNLLKDLIETKYLNIAHFIDIWTMKLWAIQNRATNKDYIDLYYILQKLKLKELINYFYKKFDYIVNENILLKSLVYFDDIENQDLILNDDINFEQVKKYLINLVLQN